MEAVQSARRDHPDLSVKINSKTGLPSSITGLSSQPSAATRSAPRLGSSEVTPDEVRGVVKSFFQRGQIGASVSPTRQDNASYPLDEAHGVRKDQDIPGQYITKVTQQVDGIPVFGASAKVVVSTKSGSPEVVAAAPNFSPLDISHVTHNPSVREDQAIEAARSQLAKEIEKAPNSPAARPLQAAQGASPAVQLVIFDPRLADVKTDRPEARLAWMISLADVRVFVDAETKARLFLYVDRHSIFQPHIHDLAGAKSFTLAMAEANIETGHPDLKTARDNVALAYNFYKSLFKRESFNDQGGDVEVFARYAEDQAFWCTAVSEQCPKVDAMVFGTGWPVLDITAHEFTHGVIEYAARLSYFNEPGAVNESFADIFGTLIKLENGGSTWAVGDTLPGHTAANPLRDMADPHLNVFRKDRPTNGQPESYEEALTSSDVACAIYVAADNGCIHLNSGILNKAAYLISEGGRRGAVTITGIGRKKLARLAYRVMVNKLGESTGMVTAANGFREACEELREAREAFTPSDCQQVDRALTALRLTPES